MHLIQKHTLDIRCASADFGKEVHALVGNVMERELYHKLELLLDQYSDENYTWKIENLKLELPPISKKNWKTELVQHILTAIEVYLKSHSSSLKENQTLETNSENELVSRKTQSKNLFFYFLKTGYLPENGKFKNLETLLFGLEINEPFVQELVLVFLENPSVLVRFISVFSEDFKNQIQNQTVGFSLDKKKFLKTIFGAKPTIFSENEFENWVAFIAWQFYFFKEKKASITTIKTVIEQFSMQHWDLKQKDFLIFKAFLNPENKSTRKETSIFEDESLTFWGMVLDEIILGNKSEDILENTQTKTPTSKIENLDKETNIETSNWFPDATFNSKTQNTIYIENAGLVLFHPFLKSLFEQLQLTKKDIWTSKSNQHKAILLTQFLITGQTKIGENELVLNKILCGMPVENVVNTKLKLTNDEIEKCQSLLLAVIEHWKILGDTSITGLRETFLQRKGKITVGANKKLELWVKQTAIDVLMDRLPWGIKMIQTPWMKDFLECYWN
jgi:Contractile injection system tape measure protein